MPKPPNCGLAVDTVNGIIIRRLLLHATSEFVRCYTGW